MKMKNRFVVAALAAAFVLTSVEASLSKAQTAAIGKSFASLPKAEFAAKAAELVSKAVDADKKETALAAVKAAIAKAPASAPVVVAAIAQIAPDLAPAVAAAAAKLSPTQADVIAKAAALAAPSKAAGVMAAVMEAAPKSNRAVASAVLNAVPSVMSTAKIRSREQAGLSDGGGTIVRFQGTLYSVVVSEPTIVNGVVTYTVTLTPPDPEDPRTLTPVVVETAAELVAGADPERDDIILYGGP